MKPLTEYELQIAARKYCELMGKDPDESIIHGADPSPDGTMTMQLCSSPMWTRVVSHIRQQHAIDMAILFARPAPRVATYYQPPPTP